jgi:hypothetical protein
MKKIYNTIILLYHKEQLVASQEKGGTRSNWRGYRK